MTTWLKSIQYKIRKKRERSHYCFSLRLCQKWSLLYNCSYFIKSVATGPFRGTLAVEVYSPIVNRVKNALNCKAYICATSQLTPQNIVGLIGRNTKPTRRRLFRK